MDLVDTLGYSFVEKNQKYQMFINLAFFVTFLMDIFSIYLRLFFDGKIIERLLEHYGFSESIPNFFLKWG